MKKIIAYILMLSTLLGVLIIPSHANTFSDVLANDWFASAVKEITRLGIMSGVGNNKFSPYEAVNRAMAVQVLYKLSGDPGSYSNYFSDVKANAWYADAVCWAKENSVVSGTSKDKFSPNKLLTRQELAAILCRYMQNYPCEPSSEYALECTDIGFASEWARADIEKACAYGIFSLRENGAFSPFSTVSRADLAATLLRMLGDYQNGAYDPTIHVTEVYLSVKSATLIKGQSLTLRAGINPLNAFDTAISFSSSDADIATVDQNGTVKAKLPGKVRISAVSRDGGVSAHCDITVSAVGAFLPTMESVKSSLVYSSSYSAGEMKPVEPKPESNRHIDPNKPMVALTYDDGPRPKSTNRILDCLEKYNCVATFFELGSLVENYPACVAREVAIGCEVGNHSYNHPNLATLSASGIQNQLWRTNNAIYNAGGVWPSLLRPPYGSYNSTVRNNAGMPIIIWSIDTLDWKYRNASYVTGVIKNNVTDGSIILMHSIYDSTAAATEAIVPWLIGRGYQLVTVSEMAAAKKVQMKKGANYFAFYD